jgi:hypothetical protein
MEGFYDTVSYKENLGTSFQLEKIQDLIQIMGALPFAKFVTGGEKSVIKTLMHAEPVRTTATYCSQIANIFTLFTSDIEGAISPYLINVGTPHVLGKELGDTDLMTMYAKVYKWNSSDDTLVKLNTICSYENVTYSQSDSPISVWGSEEEKESFGAYYSISGQYAGKGQYINRPITLNWDRDSTNALDLRYDSFSNDFVLSKFSREKREGAMKAACRYDKNSFTADMNEDGSIRYAQSIDSEISVLKIAPQPVIHNLGLIPLDTTVAETASYFQNANQKVLDLFLRTVLQARIKVERF